MKKPLVLILAVAIITVSGLAAAQEKGPGQAPPQPMMGTGMMCPCMQMMPQMKEKMDQLRAQGAMTPEAHKQMADMMAQMQGGMQQCPMMKMMQQQAPPPQPAPEKK